MKSRRPIRVGTDCSGIEAPIQALTHLGIPFRHLFSSDIDPYCRQSILANYEPEILYDDMTKRNVKDLPSIDLYVCGFPCQSFSSAGKRKGMKEKRGQIFWHCLDVIEAKQPSVFILENVKGLLSNDNGKTFDTIIDALEKVCGGKYTIYCDLLDTKSFGIPQHRERLFFIGIKGKTTFDLSDIREKKMKPIESFIDYSDTTREKIPPYVIRSNVLQRIPKDAVFIDIGFVQNNFPNADQYSPSVTTGGNLWCVPMQRHANVKELLALQHFPTRFKKVVSTTQLKKQIGNSMSVCVLEAIFKGLYDDLL